MSQTVEELLQEVVQKDNEFRSICRDLSGLLNKYYPEGKGYVGDCPGCGRPKPDCECAA